MNRPPLYGTRENKYEVSKRDDGFYHINRKGSDYTDGNLYTTKARANRQVKIYNSLEEFTGEIRISTGAWWSGIPFLKPEERETVRG